MFTLNNLFLLLTGPLAAYLCWHFWQQYTKDKALHNLYYLLACDCQRRSNVDGILQGSF